MTTEQKLAIFSKTALENATKKKKAELDTYKKKLQKEFSQKKVDEKNKQMALYEQSIQQLKQEKQQQVAAIKNQLRKDLAAKTSGFIDDIFDAVKSELTLYKSTTKYVTYLEKQIEIIQTIAGRDTIKWFLDSTDASLKDLLERKYNITINLNKTPILGGILAKIPSKNLYVDETFLSKMKEARETFILTNEGYTII